MGTSMRPAFFTLPAMAKVLVPLLFSVPMPANQSAPFRKICGMLARVSTLLTEVGLPHRPDWAGKGGRGRGSPRRPSMLPMRARLLAADEGAGADADVHVEVEALAEDVLAQQAQGAGLGDGGLQVLHGHRVLGADVDVALGGAHGVGGDAHAFQDGVGVALQDRAVHEGAGIALVAITDEVGSWRAVFRLRAFDHLGPGELPFHAGQESGAAAAPQIRSAWPLRSPAPGSCSGPCRGQSSRPGRCTR